MKVLSLSVVLGCLLATVAAARPLSDVGRELLAANNPPQWGAPSVCPGGISFGGYRAVVIPQHKLIAGNIQFHNRGPKAFNIHSAGFTVGPKPAFRNIGMGPIKGGLRCPKTLIPAGGFITCGFVTPADRPLAYHAFQPYFLPVNAKSPCMCDKQLPLVPYTAPTAASATATANSISAGFGVAKADALATSLAQAWGAGPKFTFPNPSRPPMPTWTGDINKFSNDLCNFYFNNVVATSQAHSNAEAFNGMAVSDANAVAKGALADAVSAANSIAHSGTAAAIANTIAQAFGGPATANNKATATGTTGATATGSGDAVALSGPAIAQSVSNAFTKCGAALAGNKAGAVSNSAAVASGLAQAATGCGSASAVSGTSAVVLPKGGHPTAGAALASDKALASGTTAGAKSTATAVNGGAGPAIADSVAEAKGKWESSASASSNAVATNGPAVARSSAVSG